MDEPSAMDFVEFDLESIGDDLCTVAHPEQGMGRYVRQKDGVGKYAHVEVVVAPHPGIRCYRFEWQPLWNSLPLSFMKAACLEGVKAALYEPLADGRRIALVQVTIVDGSYHKTDTDEQSVSMAAKLAVRDALSRATLVTI